jgi:hypothetical protein
VGSSTINAVGGILDNSNRAVSASNKFAVLINGPGNPANTASVGGVMAGLNQIITPTVTGRVLIIISGGMVGAPSATISVTIRIGTGAAPGNGAVLSGTVVGGPLTANESASSAVFPFCVNGLATGLALGVPIWIDLAQAVPAGGGTITLTGITVTATEI